MRIKIIRSRMTRELTLNEYISEEKAINMTQQLYNSDKIGCDSFILLDNNDNVIYSLERTGTK